MSNITIYHNPACSDRRLHLPENVEKDGTVFNTVALATELSGVLRRKVIQE